MFFNGSGISVGFVVVCIVVFLFIIGLVFFCWWKRNKILKLIINLFRCKILYFMYKNIL